MKQARFLIIIGITALLSNCINNIKFSQNPLNGQVFRVTFQSEDVSAYSEQVEGERRIMYYSGTCTIQNVSKKTLAVLSIQDVGDIKNRKTSLQSGLLLSPNDKTTVAECYYLSSEKNQPIQIFYKDGEKILSEQFSPIITK